jgi:hypothetical protein
MISWRIYRHSRAFLKSQLFEFGTLDIGIYLGCGIWALMPCLVPANVVLGIPLVESTVSSLGHQHPKMEHSLPISALSPK